MDLIFISSYISVRILLLQEWSFLLLGEVNRVETAWRQLGRGDLTNLCKYLKGESQQNGARLFSVMPSARTGGSGYKLKRRRSHLKIRKHFFTIQVMEHGNRLSEEIVESPPWRSSEAA